jgi:hypothetical protein
MLIPTVLLVDDSTADLRLLEVLARMAIHLELAHRLGTSEKRLIQAPCQCTPGYGWVAPA